MLPADELLLWLSLDLLMLELLAGGISFPGVGDGLGITAPGEQAGALAHDLRSPGGIPEPSKQPTGAMRTHRYPQPRCAYRANI